MRLRYVPFHGLVTVRAGLLGPSDSLSCVLAVDTGSAYTLIRPQLLRRVGCLIDSSNEVALATVGGLAAAPPARPEEIRALGVTRRRLPVVAHVLPAALRIDGLLGLDFLRAPRLTIDSRRGEIDLEP